MTGSEIALSLILTALSYGFGPMALAFFTKKKMKKSGLVVFCTIYTTVIYTVWAAVNYAASQGGYVEANATPALIWGFLFYFIAKKRMRGSARIIEKPKQKDLKGQGTEAGIKALTHLGDKDSLKQAEAENEYNTESAVGLLEHLRDECEDKSENKQTEVKKQSNGLKLFCFFLIVVCAILAICCVNQYQKINEIEESIAWLEARETSLQERVDYYKGISDKYTKEETSGNLVKTGAPDYVFITKSGECYHMAGCKYITGSATRVSILTALAEGYRPCSYCLG